ncbi:MAG: hypothetical protein O9341_12865 [Paucibacter sp.]|nr:hypothetical protein [Roseateles sp.]
MGITMNRPFDFEGLFTLSASHGVVTSGYQPQHALHENYQSSGRHTYPDHGLVRPGEMARVEVHLISPEVYPHCLWEGRVLDVLEGSRQVGTLEITRIATEGLLVAPESYKQLWEEPAELRGRL